MKKILLICSVFLAMVSCQEDYELNADFTVPTELNSPASIQLDVSSSVPVVLSWSGGGAADGGIVLYEVLFDKADGDFSKPLATMKSDLGANPSLSITHALSCGHDSSKRYSFLAHPFAVGGRAPGPKAGEGSQNWWEGMGKGLLQRIRIRGTCCPVRRRAMFS